MDNNPNNLMWIDTVIFQTSDDDLYNKVLEYVISIDCQMYRADKDSNDITAIPGFVIIVDRNEITKDIWDVYVEFVKEAETTIPCLLLDDLSESYNNPKLSNHFYISSEVENKLDVIKRIIDYGHAKAIFEDLTKRVTGIDEFDELLNELED